jgi:hypothetical protein
MSTPDVIVPDIGTTAIESLIDEFCYNAEHRKILKRRFIDGVCIEPLAEEFEISVSKVKKIINTDGKRVLSHYPIDFPIKSKKSNRLKIVLVFLKPKTAQN